MNDDNNFDLTQNTSSEYNSEVGAPIMITEQTASNYEADGPMQWHKSGWGKAIIGVSVIIVALLVLLVALLSLNLKNNSKLSLKINPDDFFTVASSSSLTFSSSSSASSSNSSNLLVKDPTRILVEKLDRPLWGNPSSTLVIVEFADFQCSVCEEEFPIIRGFVTRHKNEVLYIFRNYIVKDDNSSLLAQAALCAGDQGKFWILHDRLYANFGNINSVADLQSLIQSLGMDWNQIAQCIESGKYVSQVTQDMNDAQILGVAGTPTFFVNGKKIEGAVTTEDWEAILSRYKQIIGENNK